ncbi:leucine-rich repeat-containing protein kinase family protein [uncultured Hymenobacter sp.]|uniref:leucine-rich repeat-containing protein kinase family protein n=1 Tax=uncultured Hymenobacter sp. TaxID=170016 RepID=UPI0035CA7332
MHTLAQLRAGELAGLTRLDLAESLTEFPPAIFSLADSLEILNLSGNALTSLPPHLPRLGKLRVLFCSDNQFTELPAVLGQCAELEMIGFKANQIRTLPAAALPPRLRWLILTDNQLATLPAELGECASLQKLMLAGNQLTSLPETLANCRHLELLRIAANRLDSLPPWLLTMPRLAWLAYGGNPFSAAAEDAALRRNERPQIPWSALTLHQQLGAGASGVIYRAEWQPAGSTASLKAVAVKLFKGAVTSDGLPRSEMAACLSAGQHPQLIAVEGQISGHPAGAEGLVLELISPEFGNLAGPPSLASCTRDVYAPGTMFTLAAALCIAHGIAAAAAHLHERGILHGDLYAHNILTTSTGESLLGDFGAACFFDSHDAASATALQRLEVRAFGLLLEELLARLAPSDAAKTDAATLDALTSLQQQCGSRRLPERPLFAEIAQTLARLQQAESSKMAEP